MPREDNKDKFQHFADLYGKETEETFRPSFEINLDEPNKALLTSQNTQQVIQCIACTKPRLVYAQRKSWKSHQNLIERHLEVP